MKIPFFALAAGILLALPGAGSAAKPKKPSKFSEFAGSYSGTLLLTSSGTAAFGPTQGSISASKKKESGAIKLSSVVSASGTNLSWAENFTLRNKAFNYLLLLSSSGTTTVGSGPGTMRVGKAAINYSGSFISDGNSFVIFGSMKKTKKGLSITETVIGNSATITLLYDLKKKGK